MIQVVVFDQLLQQAVEVIHLGGKLVKPVGAVRVQIIAQLLSVPLFLLVPAFNSWIGVAASIYFLSIFIESVRPPNNVAISLSKRLWLAL